MCVCVCPNTHTNHENRKRIIKGEDEITRQDGNEKGVCVCVCMTRKQKVDYSVGGRGPTRVGQRSERKLKEGKGRKAKHNNVCMKMP